MIEVAPASLVLAAAGGALIGLLYFTALWWTVSRLPSARRPGLLVVGTFLIRAGVAAGGIVFVAGGEPLPLVAGAIGFLVGRNVLIRVVGKPIRAADVGLGAASVSGGEAAQGNGITARRH